ncbi:MAG TPA: hypothetical protein VK190_02485 [Pseudoneobacillus sp.]|nr:hypothetical protein [Pseudoneobacillus sp.]
MEKEKQLIKEEVYTKGHFAFAKVIDKTTGKTITGTGFAKYDNDDRYPFNETRGKEIALGRAKKEIKKQIEAIEAKKAKRNTKVKVVVE